MPPKNSDSLNYTLSFEDVTRSVSSDYLCSGATIFPSPTCEISFGGNIVLSDDLYKQLFGEPENKEEEKKENMNYPTVKSIKYDNKYTIVTWGDGTKTRVGCCYEDAYGKYNAFCSALAKKIFGTSSQVRKIVETKDEAIEIEKKRKEREERDRLAEVERKRRERRKIKHLAKKMLIEKKAKQLMKEMLEEETNE